MAGLSALLHWRTSIERRRRTRPQHGGFFLVHDGRTTWLSIGSDARDDIYFIRKNDVFAAESVAPPLDSLRESFSKLALRSEISHHFIVYVGYPKLPVCPSHHYRFKECVKPFGASRYHLRGERVVIFACADLLKSVQQWPVVLACDAV